MGKGHIAQRGKDSWQLKIYAGQDARTGRSRYRTETVRGGRRAAEKRLHELILETDGRPREHDVSLSELLARWSALKSQSGSPSTARVRRDWIENAILPYFGDVPARKLTTESVDAFYEELSTTGTRWRPPTPAEQEWEERVQAAGKTWRRQRAGLGGKPLAPATVRRIHGILRAGLEQGVKWDLLDKNVAANATLPSVRKPEITIPSDDQVRQLYRHVVDTNPEFAFFIRIDSETGLRRGEVCGLKWSDFDKDHLEVRVQRTVVLTTSPIASREFAPETRVRKPERTGDTDRVVKRQFVIKETPKTDGSARRITLDARLWSLFEEHKAGQRDRAEAHGTGLVRDPFVFSDLPDGSRPKSPAVITHMFGTLRKQVGADNIRLHDLRHYVATTLMRKGVYVRVVSERLGHRSTTTTLNTYSQWQKDADRQAASVMATTWDE